jgi:hypothetical protein
MTADTYDVYFSGAVIKGNDPDEVKRKIGALFKLQGDKLERLFKGDPVPIKRGVDMDRAIKFRVAFRDAGGLVDIVPAGDPPPQAKPRPAAAPRPPATTSATAPGPESSGLTLADGPLEPVADAEANTPAIAVPEYELSSEQGFDLSDCAPVVEAVSIPDISSLDLDKQGSTLDESPEPEVLEIDTSALELDKPGAALIEESPPEPPDIDTADLSMLPPNQGSLEDCQTPVEPAPIPNIDHLHIEKAESAASPKAPQGKAKFKIAEE